MKRLLTTSVLILLAACARPKGDTGAPGSAGTNGVNGVDTTPITLVQFCPGTTHFPDTFCEVGFCIGGNLYGTYSANDGFSVLIPPGTYSSNGINCSCNFTVASNCQVNQ